MFTTFLASYAGLALTGLKYVGICLAAASSIWGMLHEFTRKTARGAKRLTRDGAIAVGLIALGLAVSVLSDQFQRLSDAETASEETKRTNEIILSGQPLSSLDFKLYFLSSDPVLRTAMERGEKEINANAVDAQGGTPPTPFEAEDYEQTLLPLINYIARMGNQEKFDPSEDNASKVRSTAVLVALDNSPNAVLSFGKIESDIAWERGTKKDISAGFLAADGRINWPSYPRAFANYDQPTEGVSRYVEWELDPATPPCLRPWIDRLAMSP